MHGHRTLVAAEGLGPVDAMSNALREALVGYYPDLLDVRLADYKVRVLTPEEGTAAKVRVLIEHRSQASSGWHTVGVSNNLLDASWQALSDGIRYHLMTTNAQVVARQATPYQARHTAPAAAAV